MNGWPSVVRHIVLVEGAIAFGLAAFTLIEYWRRWRAGETGPLPQHIALMAASYLLIVGATCGMLLELVLWPKTATGDTIREFLELRWYRAPLIGFGLILGVAGLGRLLRYEHARRKAGVRQ